MGGSFRNDSTFNAPYVSSKSPLGDPFSYTVIIKDSVAVHESPDSSSPVISTLSYDIVKKTRDHYKYAEWMKIILHDNREGYILKGNDRSPISYRATFVKRSGKWIMKHFIAGD